MKKLFLLVFFASIAIGGTANDQTKSNLPAGKNIPVKLTTRIYSNSNNQIEPAAVVDTDIRDDSGTHILIRQGTPVILDAQIQKARGVGKPASVKLSCMTTTTVDGQTIKLRGEYYKEGESRKGAALGIGLGVGIPFFLPGLFFLCLKGEKITIYENTLFQNIYTDDSYQISISE